MSTNLPKRMAYKRGQYWHIAGDKKRKWTALGSDLDIALARHAELEGKAVPPFSVPHMLDKYLEGLKVLVERGKRAQSTYEDYASRARALKRMFPHHPAVSITSKDVTTFLREHPHPHSGNAQVMVLRSAFAACLGWKEWTVQMNPCLGVLENEEEIRTRYITDDEYLTVYAVMPPWIQCIMRILYLTSLRISDVLTLKAADCESLLVTQRKTGTKQEFEISAALRSALDDARALRNLKKGKAGRSDWLFPSRRGKAIAGSSFRAVWHPLKNKTGVKDFHCHDIRAKALTDADDLGLNAQLMAGHMTRAQTDHYVKRRKTIKAKSHSRDLTRQTA